MLLQKRITALQQWIAELTTEMHDVHFSNDPHRMETAMGSLQRLLAALESLLQQQARLEQSR